MKLIFRTILKNRKKKDDKIQKGSFAELTAKTKDC